jgi:hypothetical protein
MAVCVWRAPHHRDRDRLLCAAQNMVRSCMWRLCQSLLLPTRPLPTLLLPLSRPPTRWSRCPGPSRGSGSCRQRGRCRRWGPCPTTAGGKGGGACGKKSSRQTPAVRHSSGNMWGVVRGWHRQLPGGAPPCTATCGWLCWRWRSGCCRHQVPAGPCYRQALRAGTSCGSRLGRLLPGSCCCQHACLYRPSSRAAAFCTRDIGAAALTHLLQPPPPPSLPPLTCSASASTDLTEVRMALAHIRAREAVLPVQLERMAAVTRARAAALPDWAKRYLPLRLAALACALAARTGVLRPWPGGRVGGGREDSGSGSGALSGAGALAGGAVAGAARRVGCRASAHCELRRGYIEQGSCAVRFAAARGAQLEGPQRS